MTEAALGLDAEATYPSQAFRISSSSEALLASSTIKITTHLCNRIGQYVILWADIQRVFKDVQYIMHNGITVPFMTDDNLQELSPPRILYRPGVILDIVLDDDARVLSVRKQADLALIDHLADIRLSLQHIFESQTSIQGLLQTIINQTYELKSNPFKSRTAFKSRIKALDLPEIRDLVFQYLDRKSYVKCMRLNKAWHGWAELKVWETIKLSGKPRMDPSIEALRRYGHLVKTFEIPFPATFRTEYHSLDLLNLQSLSLTLSSGNVQHMAELIYRHGYLKRLNVMQVEEGSESRLGILQLWKAIASLQNLNSLHVCNVDLYTAVNLERLRELHLLYTKTAQDTILQQLQFLSRCSSLESLEWRSAAVIQKTGADTVGRFVRMVKAGTWPKLEALTIDPGTLALSDESIASILAAMPRVTFVGMCNSAFGQLSIQSLRAHFSTLKGLDLMGCPQVTKTMLMEVLSLCPQLLEPFRNRLTKIAADRNL
ncbi:hypothetical protein BC939DRAFT_501559 [Gamsiella multidivaricata]|uniref:uncharacterized protein n=1 Tax=Gamsiella multidivaricata TaxID=101098 RepID=UPI00221F0278|nr:uncharacterized protein BC939DRAFT_501559 [Gamsiella multidivaricata]KAG0365903.1 hypothetical protein BGZ54_006070 [Gamsiella multidivaricata]KAI7826901.1 hypothetical protein BC939DRAFT_501559 [Gamsiella multidivaricata]